MKYPINPRIIATLLCLLASAPSAWCSYDGLYRRLDALLDSQVIITQRKMDRIASIRSMMPRDPKDLPGIYSVNDRLYEEYMAFKYDSAFKYVDRNIALARQMGDSARYQRAVLRMVHILSASGLFDQAKLLMLELTPARLDHQNLYTYYQQYCDLYLFNSEYLAGTSFYKDDLDKVQSYRRLLIGMAPYSMRVSYLSAYLGEQGHYDRARAMLEGYLRRSGLRSGDREYSVITSTLAFFCRCLGDTDSQERYLILCAISDVSGAVRENNSLRELSSLLFDKGDYDRAYFYLNHSIIDATFYGTRLRTSQASQLIPKVAKAYQDAKRKESRVVYALLLLLALAVVLLIAALFLTRRYMLRYRQSSHNEREINNELNATVQQLEKANDMLAAEKAVREQYLGRFMDLASTMIDRGEDYRRELNHLARDKRMDQLYARLKSTASAQESSRMFYENFDEAFLNICPDFVEQVNGLLDPGNQIEPRGERLTTELRILALICLGISDNRKIAGILRSSITTIYTYRSKLKAKAVSRETFEDDVIAFL